jgi:hypothetical protein
LRWIDRTIRALGVRKFDAISYQPQFSKRFKRLGVGRGQTSGMGTGESVSRGGRIADHELTLTDSILPLVAGRSNTWAREWRSLLRSLAFLADN